MSRLNFYILLDLDPSESDPSKIDQTIRTKQLEWSKLKNHPTKGRQANHNLDLLPNIKDVMLEPGKRDEEAKEALQELKTRQKAAAEELDQAIAVLGAHGHLTEKEVADLIKRFAGSFREADIRKRIKVPIHKDNEKSAASPKPTLEKSKIKEIEDRLQILGKADLYAFLDLNSTTSRQALLKRARQRQKEAWNNANKTATLTAIGELAGYCLQYFKSDGERAKYDNTLAQQHLRDLERLIETAGSAAGEITAARLDELLRKAREKGVSLDEAREYIRAYAAKKHPPWPVFFPLEITAASLQRCGGCGILSPENVTLCKDCGEPLQVACPKCCTTNPSEHRACQKCGFSVGDATLVRRLQRDADVASARGDCNDALQLLTEALVYWPDSKDLNSRLAQVKQRIREKEAEQKKQQAEEIQAEQNILRAIGECRFLEARTLLVAFKRRVPKHPSLEKWNKEIEAALQRARGHVFKARQLERTSEPDATLDAYTRALEECRDLTEAREGLAKCPPTPPPEVVVKVTLRTVTLQWQPSTSPGQLTYRVVRKVGSEPRSPRDGQQVGQTPGIRFVDSGTEVGKVYYYAVFADREGVVSPQGRVAVPVVRLGEVANLKAVPGDRSVALSWERPPGVLDVEVWRQLDSEPKRRGDGTRVVGVSRNGADETGLITGRTYYYRVVAVFANAEGNRIASEGVTCAVTLAAMPKPVKKLSIARRNDSVETSWPPPPCGQVQVYARAQRTNRTCGEIIPVADLHSLGQRLSSSGVSSARLTVQQQTEMCLVPVTVNGSVAVIGEPAVVSWVDDVEELKAFARDGTLFVQWRWPTGIDVAWVVFRTDRFPVDAEDAQATRMQSFRSLYEINGGFRCRVPDVDMVYLAVYAAVNRGNRWDYAATNVLASRKEVAVNRSRTLRYRVATPGWFARNKNQHRLVLRAPATVRLPELILVANPRGMPLNPNDGTVVTRMPAGHVCTPGKPLVIPFDLHESFHGRNLKLFPVHDEDCAWLSLITNPWRFWLARLVARVFGW